MKILLAYDGSELSDKAKDYVVKLGTGNEVTVLSVTDDIFASHPRARYDEMGSVDEETLKTILDNNIKFFKETAEKAAASLKDKGINAASQVGKGHPAQTICKTAREGNYDMIVMGSRGLGGLKQLFLGSVSNHVVHCSEKTVVIVK